ncbi:MAG: sodium:solute symporter family protein [Candidatus Altimarinota bacterium]
MNTLLFWILLYIVISIGIGLYASRKVRTDTDYILAGRGLPLYIVIATTFATWFGSETVLGTSSTFLNEGLLGILADPFGAGLCLILVGFFFAKPLYEAGVKTLGDFYRNKYGRTVELLASMMIIVSYVGWVSAQIVALGLIFDILTEGSAFGVLTQMHWSIIGGLIVLIYTFFGGMWSVALTDFFQMIIIVVGMTIAALYVVDLPGASGVSHVIREASISGKFNLFPEGLSFSGLIAILVAVLTMGFGSIPQQDVFQRVLSANSKENAKRGGVIGGSLYIIVAFLPIMLGFAAFMIAPELVNGSDDTQRVLPTLILEATPVFVQVMFFGALLSAIMSTASGTLLAPSALFMENILRPALPDMSDRKALFLTRGTVIGFFLIIISFVVYKYNQEEAQIFTMVENAYKITLAGAFVPLAAAIIHKRVHTISALLSMLSGIGVWISFEFYLGWEEVYTLPPHFFAFLMSIVGFYIGQMLYKWVGTSHKSTEIY